MTRRKILPYNPKLKELARKLRQNMTLSEVLLWDQLKQKKMLWFDFDRQRPIDNFIVDFYCKDLMLAIEVDGSSHNDEESFKADVERQKILEKLGVKFLRFEDLEVKKNMSNVLRTIQYWIEENMEKEDSLERPTPTPLKRGIDSPDKLSPEDYSRVSTAMCDISSSMNTNSSSEFKETTTENPLLGGVGVGTYKNLIEIAKEASVEAGNAILEVYNSDDFNVELKGDDSPLTRADKQAHEVIVSYLVRTGLPILSEEGKSIPYEERKNWEHFWMVDPLDGTKEFIKRNGEFTVNIALIHDGKAVAGVVYVPVTEKLYWSIGGVGAFVKEKEVVTNLKSNKISLEDVGLKIVASRSHLNEETQQFLDGLKNPEIVSMGSSLKLLAIADGTADVYPRFAPTMEWDTAAAHAIVQESAAKVWQKGMKEELAYNKEDLLNPHFIVLNH